MASVYRFKRKSKKEDPTPASVEKTPDSEDFFPLLFGEKEESAPVEAAEETIETAETVETADLGDTRSFAPPSLEEAQTEEGSAEDTKTFRLFESASEKKDIPEELLRALQSTPVDNQKLDDVFNHTIGTVSADSSKEDYDKTTALLREVFGTGAESKKKKKKGRGSDSLEDVFQTTKTLDEALEEAQKKAQEETENASAEETDGTKEFPALAEDGAPSLQEGEKSGVPELAEEVRVPDLENPYSDTYDELEELGLRKDRGLPEEFTSPDEYDEFSEHLRGNIYKNMVKGIWAFISFLLLLYLESATFSDLYHPEFLRPGGVYNSIIYLLVDLQLVLVSALISLSVVGNGLKGIFTAKPNRHSATALLVLLALAHPVVLLALHVQEYPLFGSLAALFLLVGTLADFLEAKRVLRTFRICGKKGEKLVVGEVGPDSAEAEAFREQLVGEPKFFSVQKAEFVDGFFARLNKGEKSSKNFGFSLFLALFLSIGFAAFTYWKEPDVALTVNRFMTMAMMTFPLSGILTVVLPFSHLSKKAEKINCAVICGADADDYATADAVSFTDREIFPSKHVKVTTIRTYGNTRIDKAILYAAMVFQKLGGPLSHVFKKTISGVYAEIPENFDFLEITADGLCAKIDGKDIFVGNKNYLLSYDFGYTKDTMDAEFESKSGKIMYMVIDSELAAKFYIRYSMSRRFRKTIISLFKCGICPAVKTCDPNIDSELFRILLQNDKIPSGIIKTCDAMKDAPALESVESGLVCTSSIANLLSAFTVCDALHHLRRSNTAMKIFSMLIGAAVVFFLYNIGDLNRVSGLFALIYQLMWLVPVVIPSLTE